MPPLTRVECPAVWAIRRHTQPAGLSVSPITRSETNLDVSVEESGPVRADEFDPLRVDEFGPTNADEDVVQEAEELKRVPP